MSNYNFTSQGGTNIGKHNGEVQIHQTEFLLTTRPSNSIVWLLGTSKRLKLLSSNSIAQYVVFQLEGGDTLPVPYKPCRQAIPVDLNTEVDDIIKHNKNAASIITLNQSVDKDHYQVYHEIKISVDEKTWQLFIFDDRGDNMNDSNYEYAEYKVNIDIYKMVDRLIKFAKESSTNSEPVKLIEALQQIQECLNKPTSGNYPQDATQCAALLNAAHRAFDNYNPNTTAAQASLDPFVTHMMFCKMKDEDKYKEYYLNRAYNTSDKSPGNALPNTVKDLITDVRRYNTEHTHNNNNNLIKQGTKRTGNSGSSQVNKNTNHRDETDEQSDDKEGIERHKKRKVEFKKRRKAADNKKRIEQSAPTGRPIKEKDKSHRKLSPETVESIEKVRSLKTNNPLWNSEDKSKWIKKNDKTGFVCVKCKGTKYEFTHTTERCRVQRGQKAPTGRNNSPYTFDTAFDHEGWANGKNRMDDSTRKDN